MAMELLGSGGVILVVEDEATDDAGDS